MNYRTKKDRLCAMADHFCTAHGLVSFKPRQVANWAMRHGLYPVPKRGDPEDLCEEWEEKLFAAVKESTVLPGE